MLKKKIVIQNNTNSSKDEIFNNPAPITSNQPMKFLDIDPTQTLSVISDQNKDTIENIIVIDIRIVIS